MAYLPVDAAFTTRLPKVELHAHLSGSISVATLHEIWQKLRVACECLELEDPVTALPAEKVYYNVFTFFPLFDNYIYELCSTIDAIGYTTLQVLRNFEDDGVRYLELRTTPRERVLEGITKDLYVTTVLDCIENFSIGDGEGEGRGTMSTSLILSIDRRNTPAQGMETVDLALKYRHRGIVGVDLCGNPTKGNVTTFRDAIAKARSGGLKITLHFAEVPQSSTRTELEALLSYRPDRLGHVINVPQDICQKIEDEGIGLELCLSCNVHAKLIPGGSGFADHHLGYWKDKTCPISLCTDDVGVVRSSVSNEYLLAAQHFHLSRAELIRLSEKAVSSIFAGEEEKARMKRLLSGFRAQLEDE